MVVNVHAGISPSVGEFPYICRACAIASLRVALAQHVKVYNSGDRFLFLPPVPGSWLLHIIYLFQNMKEYVRCVGLIEA